MLFTDTSTEILSKHSVKTRVTIPEHNATHHCASSASNDVRSFRDDFANAVTAAYVKIVCFCGSFDKKRDDRDRISLSSVDSRKS